MFYTLLGVVQCSIPAVPSVLELLFPSVLRAYVSTLLLRSFVRCDALREGEGHFSITDV